MTSANTRACGTTKYLRSAIVALLTLGILTVSSAACSSSPTPAATAPSGVPTTAKVYRATSHTNDGEWQLHHVGEGDERAVYWNNWNWHECGYETRANPYGSHDISIKTNYRFPNVDFDQEALVAAYLEFTVHYDYSGTGDVVIKGEAADNPGDVPHNNPTDWENRVRTSASVTWPSPSGDKSDVVRTPDIKSVVEEIVKRPGWSPGNAVNLFVEHDLSAHSGMMTWEAAGDVSGLNPDRPRLIIELLSPTPAPSPTPTPTP